MTFKIIIYTILIIFIYRSLLKFISNPDKASNKKRNQKGKEIEFKDADFKDID